MAETVLGLRVQVRITGRIVGDDGAVLDIDETYDETFDDGTGSDQLGSVWQDKTRPLNATSEDLDVQGGLNDFQGAALALNPIKLLYMRNLDEDTGDTLKLKQGSANPVTTILGGTGPTVTIGPKGILLLVSPIDGYATTAGSADKIAAETADNSNYRIIVGGDNS